MLKFKPFTLDQQTYNLSHLNAFYTEFVQVATKSQSEKRYRCLIEFGTHCFTKSPNVHKGETLANFDNSLHYVTDKEIRLFCPERYQLSLKLPEILRNLDKHKCYFTSANDKFLTISIQNQQGEMVDYEIYFSLKKSKTCDVHIFINSAYLRSLDYRSNKTMLRRKPVSLFVLLHNTITNKRIKRPV